MSKVTLTVNNPVAIDYTNRGNALTRFIFVGDDNDPTTPHLEFVNKAMPTRIVPGKYECILFSRIYTQGSQGGLCDSDLMINGNKVANIHVAVPAGKESETDIMELTLVVSE
jgi:hypothetical protein